MTKILGNFLRFFKINQNSELAEFKKHMQEQMDAFDIRLQALDEESVAVLEIVFEETKGRQNLGKGLKSAADIILKHSKDIKSLTETLNNHSSVINNNMTVLNEHLKDEHDITLSDDPDETVHDVMKTMKKKTVKKDEGNN